MITLRCLMLTHLFGAKIINQIHTKCFRLLLMLIVIATVLKPVFFLQHERRKKFCFSLSISSSKCQASLCVPIDVRTRALLLIIAWKTTKLFLDSRLVVMCLLIFSLWFETCTLSATNAEIPSRCADSFLFWHFR